MNKIFVAVHALINNNNKYLVIRRSNHNDHLPLYWDIPGGSVEFGETVEQSLIREVAEEVSLQVIVDKPIFVFTDLSDFPRVQFFQIVYSCNYVNGSVKLNPTEHDRFEWMEYDKIGKLDNLIPFLSELLIHVSDNGAERKE